jgi:hypothetical protein
MFRKVTIVLVLVHALVALALLFGLFGPRLVSH